MLLLLARAAVAAEGREVESRFLDGRARNFDSPEIARAEADVFGEAESTVADFKGRGSAIGHGVEAHDGHADGIDVDTVGAGNDHAWTHGGEFLPDPRTLAAGHGVDAFNDREVDGLSLIH